MQYRTLALACSMIYATCASAAQPPDYVVSDSEGNTAGGSYAMLKFIDPSPAGSTGGNSTAFGAYAMENALTQLSTAFGAFALQNTTGSSETAIGWGALRWDSGVDNTAVGSSAMGESGGQSGSFNTAVGSSALGSNTSGMSNVSVGIATLATNGGGSNNVAVGAYALRGIPFNSVPTNASQNTAVGDHALYEDTEGAVNTAVGANALYHVGTGYANVAVGYSACWACKVSFSTVALGNKALYNNESGMNNIAIGDAAGYNATGSNNIEIGNAGLKLDAGIVRIGTVGKQSTTFIAGINSSQVVGAPVYVTSSGQLGVLASSERYKTNIRPLESDAAKFAQLRPVTFHLKTDPQGTPQYGLIAEELNKLYPDLVIHDSAGTIHGVRYDEVTSLLLAQVQLMEKKQQAIFTEVEILAEQNKLLRAQLEALGGSASLAAGH